MKRMPRAGVIHGTRLFLAVFVGAFAIIGGAQFLKGHTLNYSVTQGLLWGAISAAIFVAAHYYRRRKGQRCVVCEVTKGTADLASKDNISNS